MVQGWQEEFLLSSVRVHAHAQVCTCVRSPGPIVYVHLRVGARVRAFSRASRAFSNITLYSTHTGGVEALGYTLAVPLLTASCCQARCQETLPPAQPLCLHRRFSIQLQCFVRVISFLRDCRVEPVHIKHMEDLFEVECSWQ